MADVLLFCHVESYRGWCIKVHKPHVPVGQLHVHVTKGKLDYSWNVDGSRHDKHRFPKSEKGIKTAKRIAAERLGIAEASLRFLTGMDDKQKISIWIADASGKSRPIYSRYIRSGESALIFGSPLGMVVYTTTDLGS